MNGVVLIGSKKRYILPEDCALIATALDLYRRQVNDAMSTVKAHENQIGATSNANVVASMLASIERLESLKNAFILEGQSATTEYGA